MELSLSIEDISYLRQAIRAKLSKAVRNGDEKERDKWRSLLLKVPETCTGSDFLRMRW